MAANVTTKKVFMHSALAAVVSVGLSMAAVNAQAAPKLAMEKCYGIAKAGQNDCGSTKNACAGQAKTNGSPNQWLFVPKGTCKKIVGGHLKPPAAKK